MLCKVPRAVHVSALSEGSMDGCVCMAYLTCGLRGSTVNLIGEFAKDAVAHFSDQW